MRARANDLAAQVALTIFSGFQAYRADFQALTAGAQARFEDRDWAGVQQAAQERLAIYRSHLQDVVAGIAAIGGDAGQWPAIKSAYVELLGDQYNAELYETFYNSVHREITGDNVVNDAQMFVTTLFPNPPVPPEQPIFNSFDAEHGILELVHAVLSDFAFAVPWQNLDRDVLEWFVCGEFVLDDVEFRLLRARQI